jgi:hypothetical protein
MKIFRLAAIQGGIVTENLPNIGLYQRCHAWHIYVCVRAAWCVCAWCGVCVCGVCVCVRARARARVRLRARARACFWGVGGMLDWATSF